MFFSTFLRFNPTKHFFCDLMQTQIVCEPIDNDGAIFALIALINISIVINSFFIWFANQTNWSKPKKLLVKITSAIAAIFTLFIFTDLHDEFILTASIIGIIPISFTAIETLKNWSIFKPILGLISFSILTFYNTIFYLNIWEVSWPILQKMSILLCLTWVNLIIRDSKKLHKIQLLFQGFGITIKKTL